AMTYTGLMWQDLKKSGQIRGRKMPPTVVVVLYTSKKHWRTSLNISDMVQSVVGMERFLPHMEYLLVDINTISKKRLEVLIAHGNLAAVQIAMELCRSREELRVLIKRLKELLQPEQISLRRDFVMWLQRVLLPRQAPTGATIPELADLEDIGEMLAETVQKWVKPWRDEGRQEGKAEMLLRQLQRRFPNLPGWVEKKVLDAKLEVLGEWSDRFVDARSLQDIFGDEAQGVH
ncbi:MAG: Rpn family recombination-promoting nuclease/putative transposase, partial [Magnetococcales bacterium]|nr:Rpn family recombination-promoting nuclease/putative transposase [Magnetococcales bacterium]